MRPYKGFIYRGQCRSQLPLTFLLAQRRTLLFITQILIILVMLGMGCLGMRYSIWLRLLPLLNFSVGFILELMYVLLFKNIVSNLIYLCGQGGNRCQRVFELDKLPDVDKTRKSVSFQNLRSK